MTRLRAICWSALALILIANNAFGDDAKSIRLFSAAVAQLSSHVDPAEAKLLSFTAHNAARELARQYRVIGPAEFQNFLIHIGVRQRGYCFQWAHDIGSRLRSLHLKTLDLHWGAAEVGTLGEHNCIVVTARGQPFDTGYIIDGWRYSGRLFWWSVTKDRYLWKEDLAETAALQRVSRR